jgi:hypothetical protein
MAEEHSEERCSDVIGFPQRGEFTGEETDFFFLRQYSAGVKTALLEILLLEKIQG